MAGGSEGDALGGVGGVGVERVVGGDEAGEIDQVGEEWGLAGLVGGGDWIRAHAVDSPSISDDF